jgi:hypothetical protein
MKDNEEPSERERSNIKSVIIYMLLFLLGVVLFGGLMTKCDNAILGQ